MCAEGTCGGGGMEQPSKSFGCFGSDNGGRMRATLYAFVYARV